MNSLKYYEQNQKLINSDSFKNTALISSRDFSFYFNDTKFLWKELMKINTTYILRNKDLSLLEPYVENILYSRLFPDDVDMLSNDYIIQLVTLLQLTGQYLVYSQQKLELEIQELEARIILYEEHYEDNEELRILIDNLKKQNREKDFLIKINNNIIKNGYNINNENYNNNLIETDIINLRSKKVEIKDRKKYYYCKICANKKFITQEYLDKHMKRRHYDINIDSDNEYQENRESLIQEQNFKKELDNKLNTIKDHFEKIILQNKENKDFYILNKRIDDLSNRMIAQFSNTNFLKNNIIQNGICRICHGNLNHIPQRNVPEKEQVKLEDNNIDNKNRTIVSNINKTITEKRDTNIIIEENIKYNKNFYHNNENENIKDNNKIDINNGKENIQEKKLIYTSIKKGDNNNNIKDDHKQNNIENNKNQKNPLFNNNNEVKLSTNIIFDNNPPHGEEMYTNKGNDEDDQKNEERKNINNNIKISVKNEEEPKEDNQNKLKVANINNINIKTDEKEKNKNKSIKNDNNSLQNESINKPEIDNNGGNIEIKENEINKEKNLKSDAFLFYEKFMERDNNYKGYKDDYTVIEIPPKYNTDNEHIDIKVDEKLGDPRFINYDKVDNYINNYELKLNDNNNNNYKYEKNLYKALDLYKIISEYKEYKLKNNIDKSKNTNNQINVSNNIKNSGQTDKIEDNNNINININIEENNENNNTQNNENNNNTQNNENNNTQNNENNNNNDETQNKNNTYLLQSSISLIKQNMAQSKQPLQQSIIIGHDLSKY